MGDGSQCMAACLCSGLLLSNVGCVLVWQHKGVLISSCGQQQPSHLMAAPARCNTGWSARCTSMLIRCKVPASIARQVQLETRYPLPATVAMLSILRDNAVLTKDRPSVLTGAHLAACLPLSDPAPSCRLGCEA